MYIEAFKAAPYSYTAKNFENFRAYLEYMHIEENEFKKKATIEINSFGDIEIKYDKWNLTQREGEMPGPGEGYVDMREESGAIGDEL